MPYNVLDEILKTRALDEEKNKAEIAFRDNLRRYQCPLLQPQNVTNMLRYLKELFEKPEVLLKLGEQIKKTEAPSGERKK